MATSGSLPHLVKRLLGGQTISLIPTRRSRLSSLGTLSLRLTTTACVSSTCRGWSTPSWTTRGLTCCGSILEAYHGRPQRLPTGIWDLFLERHHMPTIGVDRVESVDNYLRDEQPSLTAFWRKVPSDLRWFDDAPHAGSWSGQAVPKARRSQPINAFGGVERVGARGACSTIHHQAGR